MVSILENAVWEIFSYVYLNFWNVIILFQQSTR